MIRGNTVGSPVPDLRKGMAMTGPINMNGQILMGLPDPTETHHAASKSYTDRSIENYVQGARITMTVTLAADSWADNMQTVSVPGLTADTTMSDVICSPDPEDANMESYSDSGIKLYQQQDDLAVFKCSGVPQSDVTVHLMVFLREVAQPAQTMLLLDNDEEGYAVQTVADSEVYGAINATLNGTPTATSYDFTVL